MLYSLAIVGDLNVADIAFDPSEVDPEPVVESN
jgi:hypothetical protein